MICSGKYKPVKTIELPTRTWPDKKINKAPKWCSVDLRDGNQALVNPMGINAKVDFFDMLVKIGFKEIEVGFPSASTTEYNFVRRLITENKIPDDVSIQVLCQSREDLVLKTLTSVRGAKNVIFHIYNSTSPAQRKYTFGRTKEQTIELAREGVRCIKKSLNAQELSHIQLEYSPESFTMTEIDFALEICEAVKEEWFKDNSSTKKIIFNLPATVECYMPNVFADQVEYFSTHISEREKVIVSLHNHNDRGEGVASCEMGLLAGAERVEGCLFGNGERTGNLDIVTCALNMFSTGVDPELDFSDLPQIACQYEKLTGMIIPPRTPYAGALVFTAFSGGHQDAIRKGMSARSVMDKNELWDVPYLLIDPHDIGREYEDIIRINSQSGKGGASFVLENDYGISIPKAMQPALGNVVKNFADSVQREISSAEVYRLFQNQWITKQDKFQIVDIVETNLDSSNAEVSNVRAVVCINGQNYSIGDKGNGPLDAFCNALKQTPVCAFNVTAFHEHSAGEGTNSLAFAYVQITTENGEKFWGVGKSTSIGRAGIAAVASALNQ